VQFFLPHSHQSQGIINNAIRHIHTGAISRQRRTPRRHRHDVCRVARGFAVSLPPLGTHWAHDSTLPPSLPRTVPRPSLTAAVKLSPPPPTTTAMSFINTVWQAGRRGGGARFERRPTVQERRRDVTSNLFEDLLPESSINHAPNDRARPRPRLPASQCAALCVCVHYTGGTAGAARPPSPAVSLPPRGATQAARWYPACFWFYVSLRWRANTTVRSGVV